MFKNKIKCASCYKTGFGDSEEKAKVGDPAMHSCYYCFKYTVLVIKPGKIEFIRPPYIVKNHST